MVGCGSWKVVWTVLLRHRRLSHGCVLMRPSVRERTWRRIYPPLGACLVRSDVRTGNPAGHSGQILDTELVFGRVRRCIGVYKSDEITDGYAVSGWF